MRTTTLAASLSVMFVLALDVAPAQAETLNCTAITVTPAVISIPGVYCLTQSLVTNMATGTAIAITANNVVLDLNGFRLANSSAGTGTSAKGVAAVGVKNVTVKNGIVRGFFTGISLTDAASPGTARNYVVEDILADGNTCFGFIVEGAGSVVRNNHVGATGGTTVSVNANVWAIYIAGNGVSAINNDVDSVTGVGTGVSTAIGIGPNTSGSFIVNNRITTSTNGIAFYGTGKYRDNLTFGVTTPYAGGTNAGNNN